MTSQDDFFKRSPDSPPESSAEADQLRNEVRKLKKEAQQAKEQLAQTQRLLYDFLNNNPALSFIKDEQGRYVFASKSFLAFFQMAAEDLLGKTDFELLPESLARHFTANDDQVRQSGKAIEVVETVLQPQGNVYSLVHKFPISDSFGKQLVGGIAIDITELTEARDRALEASTLKSAFVANISHELRTPLGGILSISELLASANLSAEHAELVEALQNSANSLLSIVNDILDLSKIEAGKMPLEKEPFNLTFLVHDCSRLFSQVAKDKNLTLRTSIDHGIPEFVLGDPERIRQTLLNLISNSVKFTETGSIDVSLSIESQSQQNVTVRFEVVDTGIGIAPLKQRYIFEPFTQVDISATRKYPGTGLGLSIARHLVELMHGQMGLTSTEGSGSCFWFTVPFDRVVHSDGKQKSESVMVPEITDAMVGKSVLVVEDNPLLQKLLLMQLENLGLQAQGVSNGLEAIQAVEGLEFDLILMDCQLPVMDGLSASRQIRQLEQVRDKHTPIVALTAGAMDDDRQRCMDAGMDDYLSKPVTFKKLAEMLSQWLVLKPAVKKPH